MKKIYLAAPYSHHMDTVMQYRFEQINRMAGKLLKEGYLVYSPISHSRPIALTCGDLPHTFAFWENLDKSMIDWADEVWILNLDGWNQSVGVRSEIDHAEATNKEIFLLMNNCNSTITLKKL